MVSVNVMLLLYNEEKVWDVVVTLMYHVPDSRPDWVNVIEYSTGTNVTLTLALVPLTANDPP